MNLPCLDCRERGYCRKSYCPVSGKTSTFFKVKDKLPTGDFQGSSPSPFVGHHGYPYLNVGVLSTPYLDENAWEHDAQRRWGRENYSLGRIVDLRSSLINSRFKSHAQDQSKLLSLSQEVGMASKPVDLELNLHSKPIFRLETNPYTAPTGARAELKKATITSNPSISRHMDKVFSDIDLKANDALIHLYSKGFDEQKLSQILSVGVVGLKKSRKLVPTRWSITATDDLLSKNLISEINDFNEMDYQVYFGSYLGNYYLILCFPGPFSYELFEMYVEKDVNPWSKQGYKYSTDYEGYNGRKVYAHETAGGYYTVRLAIVEQMKKMKKKGTVIALRFITDEYSLPLGVWVTREASRKSMASNSVTFSDRILLLKYVEEIVKKKFSYDISYVFKRSKILEQLRNQTKLSSFF